MSKGEHGAKRPLAKAPPLGELSPEATEGVEGERSQSDKRISPKQTSPHTLYLIIHTFAYLCYAKPCALLVFKLNMRYTIS